MRSLGPRRSAATLLLSGVLAVALAACTSAGMPSSQGAVGPTSAASAQVGSIEPAATPTVSVDPGPSDEAAASSTISPILGCGTGQAAFFDHAAGLDRVLDLGDAEIELTTAGIGMRDGSYLADDAIPAFIGLTADERAVQATPGADVSLVGDDMVVTHLQVTVVRWSDVDFSAPGAPDDGGKGTTGSAVIGSDGFSAVVAPAAPGDYLVELGIGWQTTCLQGDGVAYGRIQVH